MVGLFARSRVAGLTRCVPAEALVLRDIVNLLRRMAALEATARALTAVCRTMAVVARRRQNIVVAYWLRGLRDISANTKVGEQTCLVFIVCVKLKRALVVDWIGNRLSIIVALRADRIKGFCVLRLNAISLGLARNRHRIVVVARTVVGWREGIERIARSRHRRRHAVARCMARQAQTASRFSCC